MTKREMFVAIREAVVDNAEMVDFINHELELLDRKASTPRKPTTNQVENEGFKAEIVATLAVADEPLNIKGIVENCPALAGLSNQRITHMLTDLRKSGQVARTYIKRVAYFAIGNENEGV